MADPISILSIVGTVVSAVGSIASGLSASKADSYNAQIAEQNAMIARNNAEYMALKQQREARLRIGAEEAGYGASGITTEGSPLDVLESSTRNAELDRQAIIYQGQVRAAGYEDQATLDSMRADSDFQNGIFKGIGGLAGGASNFLTKPGSPISVNSVSTLSTNNNPYTY
jgi:hypothetical protein